MESSPKLWLTYEEVAAHILERARDAFGLSSVEGKQGVPGRSGTHWELDAKGFAEGSEAFVIVECRRYTTSRLSQEAVAALAWRIQDTGAGGAILVSPLGLQEGAKKVAEAAGILAVTLNADATPQEFVLSFLGNLILGIKGAEVKVQGGNVSAIVSNGEPSSFNNAG